MVATLMPVERPPGLPDARKEAGKPEQVTRGVITSTPTLFGGLAVFKVGW